MRISDWSSDVCSSDLDLIETLPDGRKQNYGRFPFAVGDGRAVGGFISADVKRAIAGFRTVDNPRFGLAVIERTAARAIGGAASLNHCDFTAALDRAVCIAQRQPLAPGAASFAHNRRSTRRSVSRTEERRVGVKVVGTLLSRGPAVE